MIEIIPALMPHSMRDLQDKLELIASSVDTVQLDVMDGKFVKSRSWPYIGDKGDFEAILNEDLGMPFWDEVDFEADLMIDRPELVINEWILAGMKRLIIHIESTHDFKKIVEEINDRDIELGIALNPDTPISKITEYLEDIDFVQFMGIAHIGLQGQEFQEHVVDTIRDFHNAHPEVIISVDGGVTLDNARLLIDAGAKRLVSGSAIFNNANPAQAIKNFNKIL